LFLERPQVIGRVVRRTPTLCVESRLSIARFVRYVLHVMLRFEFGFCALLTACNPAPDSSPETASDPTDAVPSESTSTSSVASQSDIQLSPIALDDFCSTLTLVWCEASQNCCSDAGRAFAGLNDCIEHGAPDCNVEYFVAHGDNVVPAAYDPSAGAREIQRYREATADCGLPYDVPFSSLFEPGAFPRNCRDNHDCPQGATCEQSCYFVDHPDGSRCESTEECLPSSHCPFTTLSSLADDDGDPLTPADNDDDDPNNPDPSYRSPAVCKPGERAQGTECRRGECPLGLVCFGSNPVVENNVPDWSVGSCSPPVPDGQPCFAPSDCSSDVCAGLGFLWDRYDFEVDNDGNLTTIPPTPGLCAPCSPDDCGTAACIDGRCDWQMGRRDKSDGAACTQDRECISGWCASEICAPPSPNDIYCP